MELNAVMANQLRSLQSTVQMSVMNKALQMGASAATEMLESLPKQASAPHPYKADKFVAAFDFKEALNKVTIDLNRAHFWDITAVAALDKVVIKFRREGTEVEVLGLNEASATIVDRFGVHDKPDAIDQLMGH